MTDTTNRTRPISPDKVDSLLRRLKPGLKLGKAAEPDTRPAQRLFREEQDGNYFLDIAKPGDLESLVVRPRPRRALLPDHMLVDVEAACLNFRDVAISLGMYPVPEGVGMPELGCDGAGTVLEVGEGVTRFKVGDQILFIGVDSTFSRYTRAREVCAFLKPPHWTWEEAAALPLVYVTVAYSLRMAGRLVAGERIVIHSAAGGVGLAAIEMAKRIGAEIFATAGSEEKRQYLRSLGIKHVMDSRSLDWAEQVLEATGGQGVDVILNSLAGEHIDRGLAVLRPDGRFVELGKRDLVPNRMLDLGPFARTLSFISVDTSYAFHLFPERLEPIIRELREGFLDGTIGTLPTRVYGNDDICGAFRHMTTGQHIGRVVVSMKRSRPLVTAS